jgi:hypothetical protein
MAMNEQLRAVTLLRKSADVLETIVNRYAKERNGTVGDLIDTKVFIAELRDAADTLAKARIVPPLSRAFLAWAKDSKRYQPNTVDTSKGEFRGT